MKRTFPEPKAPPISATPVDTDLPADFLAEPSPGEQRIINSLDALSKIAGHRLTVLEKIEANTSVIMWMMIVGWLVVICGGFIKVMDSSQ